MMSASEEHGDGADLISCLNEVDDPRINRRRDHRLIDILMIGACCLICGGEGFTDMETFGNAQHQWLKRFLELPNGIPTHDTFNRVFSAIDPKQFMECFVRWTQSLRGALGGEIVAIDGKALRRARSKDGAIAYIVSAWATRNGLSLGQVKVDDKSNEITAIPKLLRILDLAGCIVTIDAMGCQKQIARKIIEADADYVLALKSNQGNAEKEVRSVFDDWVPPDPALPPRHAKHPHLDSFTTVDGDHGRVETRRYWISEQIDWFEDKGIWEGLRSIAMVESVRDINGNRSYERRCYLTSIAPQAERFASACRGHWGIENPLHWVMDVVFREDDSRARTGNAAENLAALRRMALNMLKTEKTKPTLSIRRKRLMAGWNTDYLLKILGI